MANCSCCQQILPMDYFPSYCNNNSHPFHCCQCLPSCHFCQQNKLVFGYCVPNCSTCPHDDHSPSTTSINSQPNGCKPPTPPPSPPTPPPSPPSLVKVATIILHGVDIPITKNPSWSDGKLYFLGFQHYAVTLGTTVIISSVLVRAMGGGNVEKAEAIQTSLFVMSINTLLQIWVGTRLPVVMGGSQAFTIPAISIALSTNANCNPTLNRRERFKRSMRRIQGASIIASFFQMIIGFSGICKIFARYLSPLGSVPLVTLTGLGLYARGFPQCIEIGLPALIILVFSTQFLPRILISKKEIIDRFAVTFSVAIIWAFAEILTLSGAYDNTSQETQMNCRTDTSGLVDAAPWIKIPYPFQWGMPTFEAGDAFSMMDASFVAVVESSGTFIASSRLSGAIPIPPTVLSRGVGMQGIGTLVDAILGTGSGSSASVEHAGLLGLTRVGSRRIVQVSAIFMLILSIIGKLGAVLASIPLPIVAALHTVLFPYVASVGLGYLQFCNLNSFRSKFILGFSLFMGLSVPQYFNEYLLVSGHGPANTGSTWFNDLMQVIFSSLPTIAIVVGFVLDRTHSHKECSTSHDNGSNHLKELMDEVEDIQDIYSLISDLSDLCS